MRNGKVIRACSSLFTLLLFAAVVFSQSGRRLAKVPVPPPDSELVATPAQPHSEDRPTVVPEYQDYRCADDGGLDRILDADDLGETVMIAGDAGSRAIITGKPKPSYTKEARRNRIQGFVTLKVLLSARGTVARVRILKSLPAGLTENAMRAACKMEFKPARRNSQAIGEWVIAEYVFRLAESSIFSP